MIMQRHASSQPGWITVLINNGNSISINGTSPAFLAGALTPAISKNTLAPSQPNAFGRFGQKSCVLRYIFIWSDNADRSGWIPKMSP